MNRTAGITRIVSITCLYAVCFILHTYAQQPNATGAPASANQEFLDAIKKGDAPKVRELLKNDASLAKSTTPRGTTAVLLAVYAQHKEIAELLIAAGIEPNIFEAAATGRIERVRDLLKKDPELVHAWSPDGWTALHLNFGNLEIAKLLLDAGSDINAVSKNKLLATPLQGAAARDWLDLARLLVARDAKVNTRGEGGGSPLHDVATFGDLEFAKLLLEHGADVNAKTDDGQTPLSVALDGKQAEMAKFLRDHGAK